MRKSGIKYVGILLLAGILLSGCQGSPDHNRSTSSQTTQKLTELLDKSGKPIPSHQKNDQFETHPKITFIELGSVNCIPCRMMQPILKSLKKKYGPQIEIIFYDVWKPEQQHYAQLYGIRLIPTQVFLDQEGKEIFRHEGFFPEEEIDKFLQSAGLRVITE